MGDEDIALVPQVRLRCQPVSSHRSPPTGVAPLEHDGGDDEPTTEEVLRVRTDAGQVQHVREHAQEGGADEGSASGAESTEQARAAYDGGRDGVELVPVTGDRRSDPQLAGVEEPRDAAARPEIT